MQNPFPYPLCDRTVTVYRMTDGQCVRTVLEGCYYVWQDVQQTHGQGVRLRRKFLLIVPGDTQQVFPGDRIYDGVGPREVEWDSFLPVLVPGLSQVAYAQVWHWEGRICHTEAGAK